MSDPQCTYLVELIEGWYADNPERLAFCQEHWRGPTGARLRWTNNLVDLPHVFVTVNLPLGRDILDLWREVTALPERLTWARGALCTLELDPHPHMHMLVARDAFKAYHKGNLIKVLARALGVKPEKVDVKAGHTRQDHGHRSAYIRGEKVDPAKQARCENDRKMRNRAGIPHYIILGDNNALPP